MSTALSLPDDEYDDNDPASRSTGSAADAPSELPIAGLETCDGQPTSEETQPSNGPVQALPDPFDPDRERRYGEILKLIEVTPQTQPSADVFIAILEGVSFRTQDFLLGRFAHHVDWQKQLGLAASDLHDYGTPLAEAVWFLVSGAGALYEPVRREAAVKTIADAFCKPTMSVREWMRIREADPASDADQDS
jgi:hypothetical protein